MLTQEAVGEKIVQRLKETKQLPSQGMSLGFFLAHHLSPEEIQVLDALEKSLGEEKVIQWLVDLMVSTGRYQATGNGTVQACLLCGDTRSSEDWVCPGCGST